MFKGQIQAGHQLEVVLLLLHKLLHQELRQTGKKDGLTPHLDFSQVALAEFINIHLLFYDD